MKNRHNVRLTICIMIFALMRIGYSEMDSSNKPSDLEGVGFVNAEFFESQTQPDESGEVHVSVDKSSSFILSGLSGGVFTAKRFDISKAGDIALALDEAFVWGRKAREEGIEGNKKLYVENGLPSFIIGFSSLQQGSVWRIHFVFSESPGEVYVFTIMPDEVQKLSELIKKAPCQQLQTKENDRKMQGFSLTLEAEDNTTESLLKAEAQCSLGQTFMISQNYKEADKWFRLAAEQDVVLAQLMLGNLCFSLSDYNNRGSLFDSGICVDDKEAIKWFRLAAKQDATGALERFWVAEAQYNLGRAYERGRGVSKSRWEAIKWYDRAAKNGDRQAKEWMEHLKGDVWNGIIIALCLVTILTLLTVAVCLYRTRPAVRGWTKKQWCRKELWAPQAIAGAMLIGALSPENSYSYYVLLRWIVCPCFAYTALRAFKNGKKNWVWILGVTAAIYNPLLPPDLKSELWRVVNLAGIGVGAWSILVFSRSRGAE